MERVSLLVVCTGNASRSVMAGLMLGHLAARRGLGLSVTTAGTHAVDGLPLGPRTLAALRTVPGLDDVAGGGLASAGAVHRSRQLADVDLRHADLVVVMEAGHLRYVRRRHPEAAPRAGALRWLVRHLAPGPGPLAARVAALDLDHAEPDPADDVVDPAGHEDAAYAACAAELWVLCEQLVALL